MKYLLIIFSILIFSSCGPKDVEPTFLSVYKTKADYTENVKVYYDFDKSFIYAKSCWHGDWPLSITAGYVADREAPYPNTCFLNITYTEMYDKYKICMPGDSMMKIIILDPYTEFYECDDYTVNFTNVNGYHGLDTAKLNLVIRNGELLKYFRKLK
jgi:hypothetical protein